MAVVDAGAARRVPGDHRPVGRRGHRRSARSPTTGRLVINWHGEVIVDVPPRTVAHDGPVYDRPLRPAGVAGRAAGRRAPQRLAAPGDRRRAARARCSRCVGSPEPRATSPGSPTSTTATSAATPRSRMPDDAGVVRVDEETGLGVALATDANGRYATLDPYAGAQLALAEAYRNVATAGAVPLAVTDCLNFGSPEDPGVMWQFARGRPRPRRRLPGARHPGHRRQRRRSTTRPATSRSTRPRSSACSASSTTSPGARPSGWQDDGPGHLPARHHRATSSTARSGPHVVHGHLGGLPPAVDLGGRAARSAEILVDASRDGLVDAAHDLSDGGLAQALAEACLRYGVGRPDLARRACCERDGVDPFTALFTESTGPRDRGGAALGGGAVHRHVHRPRLRPRPDRRRRRGRRGARRPGPVHPAAGRAARRATPPRCRPSSADGPRPDAPRARIRTRRVRIRGAAVRPVVTAAAGRRRRVSAGASP